jgi:hypothetical protein
MDAGLVFTGAELIGVSLIVGALCLFVGYFIGERIGVGRPANPVSTAPAEPVHDVDALARAVGLLPDRTPTERADLITEFIDALTAERDAIDLQLAIQHGDDTGDVR